MANIVTLGKAGRMVIPERIQIELTPEPVEAKIVKGKDGLLVITGWKGYDAAKAVMEARLEYLDRLDGIRRS